MTTSAPLLEVSNLSVKYGAIQALHDVSISVYKKEIVSVIGANGAGKSTLMNAIMGLVPRESGTVTLEGKPLAAKSHVVVSQGISLAPEGRKVFAPLTVFENLMMGAFPREDRNMIDKDLEWVFTLFPRLRERRDQYAGTLSGGEQQMLAIGRALMSRPRVLLLDEPSLGLAPILIKEIFAELKRINDEGVTILLVEQNARQALQLSHRAYVLQTGSLLMEGSSKELLKNPDVEAAYLGTLKK
ncbi:MAG TPA: ABC transporter ATP-binding protein [Synergistaceae bacterium]|jgi:branched-chain amino acid transport system ATP-binding protein|nr:MAG: Amino acid/amide ABC transporter ATP-binding protein 2, HAAT family [Synergistales bacterium 53_16]KUL03035.1 MAG: Amino acid/amide ABC transporter ATP-binding protein 2, HAAT family [Synergistales bacterium 54_9]MDK2845670.1 branched-chain amino acid transport system ATP-binding protein [Synergistales bacterium]HAA47901.1 ABC transporter ATP-binding protein [Synergistaceae bacterium]MDN5336420.1 branched-chain amino acid transport system ATP-binding protein [Synergistales bacterium]